MGTELDHDYVNPSTRCRAWTLRWAGDAAAHACNGANILAPVCSRKSRSSLGKGGCFRSVNNMTGGFLTINDDDIIQS